MSIEELMQLERLLNQYVCDVGGPAPFEINPHEMTVVELARHLGSILDVYEGAA